MIIENTKKYIKGKIARELKYDIYSLSLNKINEKRDRAKLSIITYPAAPFLLTFL